MANMRVKVNSIRTCPVCGDVEAQLVRNQRFVLPEGHPLSDGYDVLCCARCGFCFADTTVSQADYDAFYARQSIYGGSVSSGGGESLCDAARLRQTAEDIASHVAKDARILDMGCANGGLLSAFKAMGYENLCGIDPAPACAVNTTQRHGIEAHPGTLFEPPPGIEPADCVVLSHVLEHVQDLTAALEGLGRLLSPDGTLYVEVPDATRYVDYVVAPFQDFNTEHINHFSPRSLRNLLARNGYACVTSGQKDFESAPGMPYPAIFGFFRRSGDVPPLERDEELPKRIHAYVERSQTFLDEIDRRLQAVLPASGEVIVFGTGQLAMKLLAESVLGQAAIAAFADSNPVNHGRTLRGVPVLAPEQIRALPHPIVITSTLHHEAIATMIRDRLGMTNPIIRLS